MGVDTSGERTGWVTDMDGYMRMAYPGDQDWGAVFITVGEPKDPPRPGRDLSHYQTLSLELRGEDGGEQAWIGLKDNMDPDDGSETKIWVQGLSREWRTYLFPLSDFGTADVERLYVVIEFVFEPGTPAETVYFRNVQYLSTTASQLTATVTRTPTPTATPTPTSTGESAHAIYVGTGLSSGYDMGVDTSSGRSDWVTNMGGYMRMAYPGDQDWGAVFITVGEPKDPPRPGQDLSHCQTLSLELRGEVGGEQVWIGLKDNTDRDDGSETKIWVHSLSREWQTYLFSLSDFDTADVKRLYVVIEFVFEPGTPAETIDFRNVQYLPTPAPEPTATVAPTPTPTPAEITPHAVYVGTTLASGYDMGVNTSGGCTDWVDDMNGYMRMAYPSGQDWGAVFITVGKPRNPPRPGRDLSNYQTLSLELRGELGGEQVWVGLKDNTDRDDGRETKIRVSSLPTDWRTFTFPLSSFDTADLTRLYVVTEFVFEPGTPAETVYFRNIQYLP
jgi:hypothetical protein